jgi:uncharacterized protein YecT (DUF1311 family)
MRFFSVLPIVFVSMISVPAYSAECVKTFDHTKKTALEGEACASQVLNDADRDLNSSYERLLRVNHAEIFLWAAQQHWVDARNNCVTSGKEDCVAMTKARSAFFDLQAGRASGEHRMIWFGMSSTPAGPGGSKVEGIFYQFVKPASPGEELFNKVIQQEFRKASKSFALGNKVQNDLGWSADRRCFDWVVMGTATVDSGVIRVPFQSFLGCSDPKAVETTSFISVDLDHANVVQ